MIAFILVILSDYPLAPLYVVAFIPFHCAIVFLSKYLTHFVLRCNNDISGFKFGNAIASSILSAYTYNRWDIPFKLTCLDSCIKTTSKQTEEDAIDETTNFMGAEGEVIELDDTVGKYKEENRRAIVLLQYPNLFEDTIESKTGEGKKKLFDL